MGISIADARKLGINVKDASDAKGKRPQHRNARGVMNATESAYFGYLKLLLACGEIRSHSGFEPDALVLGKRRYRPDFKVLMNDGEVRLYDVKGCKLSKVRRIPKPWIEDRDRYRLALFAHAFPELSFYVTWTHEGRWFEQRVVAE